MIHLLLAIIFSAIIPILLKYAHRQGVAEEVILSFNYLIAVVISIGFVLSKANVYSQLRNDGSSLRLLLLIGIITGLAYYGAFYFYQKSVAENGVSISIAVGKMGIILPMMLSLILWKEMPTGVQWLGIAISMVAIGLINIRPKDFKGMVVRLSLLMFFVSGGMGDFFNKLFEVSLGEVYKDLFLAVVFGSALLASLYNTMRHKNISIKSMAFGFGVGIPNMLTAYYLISALGSMNAAIVFPMYSGGAIMLSIVWSLFAFGERLMKKEIAGLAFILIALVLINF